MSELDAQLPLAFLKHFPISFHTEIWYNYVWLIVTDICVFHWKLFVASLFMTGMWIKLISHKPIWEKKSQKTIL